MPRNCRLRCVITKVDTRKSYFKQTIDTLRELDGVNVFDTFIRVDSTVEWSQDNHTPIMAYRRSSRSAKEYMALTEEIVNGCLVTKGSFCDH